MQVEIAQQDADWSTLRNAAIVDLDGPIFQYTCSEPTPYEGDYPWILYSVFDEAKDPLVIHTAKEVLEIALQDPTDLLPADDLVERRQRIMRSKPRPSTERAREKVLFVD